MSSSENVATSYTLHLYLQADARMRDDAQAYAIED